MSISFDERPTVAVIGAGMFALALMLIAQVTTSSTSTSSAAAAPRVDGAELARELLEDVDSLERKEAETRFLALPLKERDRFLDTWAQEARPRGRSLELYSHLKSRRDFGLGTKRPEIRERDERKKDLDAWSARRNREDDILRLETMRKSEALAFALSALLGFGIGNFYAEAPGSGVLAITGTIIGLVVVGVGASDKDRDSNSAIYAGGVIIGATRLFDMIGALLNAKDYNEQLARRLLSASPVLAPSTRNFGFASTGLSFVFEF